MTETVRLHITPFTPDLLGAVLPVSVRATAQDISFHTIPTFPENNYGYVTLPAMEAEKIKKKLNGSILKGKKFKVDKAHPPKRLRGEAEDEEPSSEQAPSTKKPSKKRRVEEETETGVLEGFELPTDRKVKRGWTESNNDKKDRRRADKKKEKKEKGVKEKKMQARSKYTDKPELLFRTNLPPNRVSDANDESKNSTGKDKDKKKKGSARETTVHEFAKTVTHPSFLRSGEEQQPPTSEFVDGKGWVDGSGNVKEPASDRIRSKEFRPGQVPGAKEKRKAKKIEVAVEPSSESDDWTSSSGSSSDESESESASESESDNDNSDSSSKSSESAVSSDKDTHPPVKASKASASNESDLPTETANVDAKVTGEKQPSQEVHPLEALFKRPAAEEKSKAAEPTSNQFSFFGASEDIESEEETQESAEPQTPFTKKDLQFRGLRSAAPTPDTGLVNRKMKLDEDEDEDDDDDDEEDEEDDDDDDAEIATPSSKFKPLPVKQIPETEFTKWFWEHRGENNRAWKKRRRDAAKEQRQRENRKKNMKGRS
ncbi:hypothetical protein ASPZODRAFT_167284 [Penicilliopsis zonata CBS 506.65]|uniref:Suppressor protein SRP40 n=1 Tax=Penicilliopsis zonata CBS 506.65 TaxID=1073090 RepID=A0A1L9SGS8_9EURO|nr:hypothetical protein ASPZODRAFT_167284 [Penicilliopsis zonata CBS 506.65]OJJ46297.1 hypothetical protein ASPZODRAFT_167284 [Penicilliopsis zonata CBS 506.65]